MQSIFEANAFQQLYDFLLIVQRSASQHEWNLDVLERCKVRNKVERLKYKSESPLAKSRALMRGEAINGLPIE